MMLKRGSRQARELLLLFKLLLTLMVIMMEMMALSIYNSFVKIWSSRVRVDSGRQFQILDPSLVEYIDKTSIFGPGNSTNR